MNQRAYVIAMAIVAVASLLSMIVRLATWEGGPRDVFLVVGSLVLFVAGVAGVATGTGRLRRKQRK